MGKLPNEDWALYALPDALVDFYEHEVGQFCEEVDAIDLAVPAYEEPEILLQRIGKGRRN